MRVLLGGARPANVGRRALKNEGGGIRLQYSPAWAVRYTLVSGRHAL